MAKTKMGIQRCVGILGGLALLTTLGGQALAAGADSPCSGTPLTCTYTLKSSNLQHFFPNAADSINATYDKGLPPFYTMQPTFPQTLEESIVKFTKSSLSNDGITYTDVTATSTGSGQVQVSITGTTQAAAGYATMMPQFVENAEKGLAAVSNAVNDATTWFWNPPATQMKTVYSKYHDSYKEYQSPWAFYLALGLPVVNQKTVMMLNYPPSDSLCATDYLKNFTMDRWNSVLTRIGLSKEEAVLYETIVDTHPIAAPGSGMGDPIAATNSFFSDFDNAMLGLMISPPGMPASNSTIPLMVSGGPAHEIWGGIIGKTVEPGDMGVFTLPDQTLPTPWFATNHPDVTTYQVCPGDNSTKVYPTSSSSDIEKCSFTGTWDVNKDYYNAFNTEQEKIHPIPSTKKHKKEKYTDDALVADEVLDLVGACTVNEYVTNMGNSKTPKERLTDAYNHCTGIWCTETGGDCKVDQVCIQGRLDYDFTSVGHCQCEEAAVKFCADNNNQICPSTTSVTSCETYNQKYCSSSD